MKNDHLRAWLGLEHWQLGGVKQLAGSPKEEGLPREGQASGQSQPGLFWDCPHSCRKDGQSWEVPSLEGMGSTDIWG